MANTTDWLERPNRENGTFLKSENEIPFLLEIFHLEDSFFLFLLLLLLLFCKW